MAAHLVDSALWELGGTSAMKGRAELWGLGGFHFPEIWCHMTSAFYQPTGNFHSSSSLGSAVDHKLRSTREAPSLVYVYVSWLRDSPRKVRHVVNSPQDVEDLADALSYF